MERLTGLDATFLYLENPTNHMHVAMTMVLDPSTIPGGYSFEGIKDFIHSRLHVVPPFRRRLREVPLNLHHPIWVEDPNFNIDHHVRRVGAPAPGGRRELAEMAGNIASTPLDRSRPLWELWVIEGLKQGRIGVVTKIHHAAIDGASGADLMVHLLDLDPEAFRTPPPPPTERPDEHIPNDLEMLGYAAASRARKMVELVPLLGDTVRSAARVIQRRRDPHQVVGALPLTAPRTPWTGSLSNRRAVAFARLDLEDVKTIKNAAGATVNDILLTLCGGILRRYLEHHDCLPSEPLIAVCPISVRGDDTSIGNKVSAMFTSLATNLHDPRERVLAIQQTTKGAKEDHAAIGATTLQNWAEFAGPNTFNLASRLYSSLSLANSHRPIHNLVISNVPGPPFPLYYAGAEMIAAYPMGPVMEGCGLNITVISYRDSIDIGFMVDESLIPDPWLMAESVDPALAELADAYGVTLSDRFRPSRVKAAAGEPPATKASPAEKTAAKKATVRKRPTTKKAAASKPRTAKKATAAKPRTAKKASAGKQVAAGKPRRATKGATRKAS